MSKTIKTCLYLFAILFIVAMVSACGGGGGDDSGDQGDVPDQDDGGGGGGISNLSAVCPVIIDIVPGMNIKYKSQNVHGGRGPSFIMGCQVQSAWPISTYLANFPIYSVMGNEIGRFVVFDPGHRPYGNRSYSGLPGGYPPDSNTLLNSALADGSTEIFVNVKGNTCYKVNNPTIDQGTISAVGGTGGC